MSTGARGVVPPARKEPAPAALTTTAAAGPHDAGRDRCLDLLRFLALVRVVVYHTFGWAWVTLVFPSMGVMFALAGSLMARSLRRPAAGVLRGRLRRLLPPLWLYGAVVLGVLYVQGWGPHREDGPGWWLRVVCWVVPAGSPPYPAHIGSTGGLLDGDWAVQAAGPLWYLRAYLWFILLSPLLLRMFRRAPWPTLLAPLALTAVVDPGLLEATGATGEAARDFAVYGSCWLLGFAHHDGLLRRPPRYVVPALALAVMALGLWWAAGRRGPHGWDLNDIPLSQALWSFGFTALLLLVAASWRELPGPLGRLEKPVTLVNNRAMTVYLWHEAALLATVPLLDLLWDVPGLGTTYPGLLESSYQVLMFLAVWPLLGLIALVVGWSEDLAARRRPRLWPTGPAGRAVNRGPAGRAVPGVRHTDM